MSTRTMRPAAAGRAAAKLMTVGAGRITHSARMSPGFLIVGAQRCGTTSMFRALSQHPAILRPNLHKGVHYFDTNYDHGHAWYRGHFPMIVTGRRIARRIGVQPVAFESSPYYMFHPLAGRRIARDLPGVRLVVLLRDPVERAYSAHAHEIARGYETEDFPRALELEERRLDGQDGRLLEEPDYYSHSHQHHAYLARGRYSEQLDRLERLFGREHICVVDSDRFFNRPEQEYGKVLDFLGLPVMGDPKFERHNARSRAPMAEPLRARLDDYFRPFDEQLTRWLGATPSWRG